MVFSFEKPSGASLESLLDCKEIKPVNPKGNQSWIFIGRTDAEAQTPILWPPDAKTRLTGKDTDAGKDWRQEEKGMIEDEMVRCHHQLDRHEFKQALGVGDGQGSLVCYSPWGCKELDTTERLNWTGASAHPSRIHLSLLSAPSHSIKVWTQLPGEKEVKFLPSSPTVSFMRKCRTLSISKVEW